MEDKILSIKQASQFLKLHISTINRLIETGEIPSYKLGKRRLFDRDELFRWFKKHKVMGQSLEKVERRKTTNRK
jgi:excisionase family DNA binding protein